MVSIADLTKEFYLDSFATIIQSDPCRSVLCGQVENSQNVWILHVTDGHNVWKLILTKQQLEALTASKNVRQFFADFRNAIDCNKLKINEQNDVKLFTEDGKIQLSLPPSTENHNSEELASLIFHLAARVGSLAKQVNEQQPQRNVEQRRVYDHSLTNIDSHKKGNQPKFRPREGMSLLNPGSKKLKTVRGVTFD